MPKQIITPQVQAIIQLAWEHQVPAKITAEALNLKYPLVTLYYRGFKSTHTNPSTTGQLSAKQIIAALLEQNRPPIKQEADQIIKSFIND